MPKAPKRATPKAPPAVIPLPPAPVPAQVRADLKSSIAATRAALERIVRDAGDVSAALTLHIRANVGNPPLHAGLHKIQMAIGELRHGLRSANAQ
jgi:hypothetical protein